MQSYTEQDEKFSKIMEKLESLYSQVNLDKATHNEVEKEEKLDALIAKKSNILKQDTEIAKKFEEFEKEIDNLEEKKKSLKKKLEDIDWEICLQGNEIIK